MLDPAVSFPRNAPPSVVVCLPTRRAALKPPSTPQARAMDQYTTIAVIITVAVVLLLMWLIGPRPPRS